MKKTQKRKNEKGFTLIEMLVAMGVILVTMAAVSVLFSRALGVRSRESSRTDALTSAQAALNVMSREISNSGYGLSQNDYDTVHNNGIVLADSNSTKLRIRCNVVNTNTTTSDVGEDVTYYYDSGAQSIVRHDPAQSPSTTYLVNQISSVTFQYYNYTGSNSTPTITDTPTENTSRVKITVTVKLGEVQGQPTNRTVTLNSEVTLRNSDYMMSQY
ncbi:MAG: prepilin-type N-terminal cleavage/methylation domain-containing protein [Pyrinomonadaceae bacterium]|nr:prepilin-type N-terminal cleavage/methylation domain-containing protein [Pyrinomonadaceae bacterium]